MLSSSFWEYEYLRPYVRFFRYPFRFSYGSHKMRFSRIPYLFGVSESLTRLLLCIHYPETIKGEDAGIQ